MFDPRLKALLCATTFALAVTSTNQASADLAPGPGVKRVGFSFSVHGLGAAPDRTLFAYPCSASDGAPMIEQVKVQEGAAIPIGRRGGGCPLYSIAKADYDSWTAKNPGRSEHAFDELVTKSVRCTGGPTPQFEVASSDPRTGIQQTLDVTTLNATTCVLTARPIAAPAPAAAAASTAADPASGASKSSSSRCSFVQAPADATSSRIGVAFVALLGAIVARRRRP